MLLTKFSQFLSKYTTPVVLIFAVVAFIYSPSFAWVKGDTQTIILGIIMLAGSCWVILHYKYYRHHWVGIGIIAIGLLINTFLISTK